jgi:hypothetical protein
MLTSSPIPLLSMMAVAPKSRITLPPCGSEASKSGKQCRISTASFTVSKDGSRRRRVPWQSVLQDSVAAGVCLGAELFMVGEKNDVADCGTGLRLNWR